MTAIYFDLDGTLTDPKAGITRSIQYALSKLDRAVPPEHELTWCIGPPLRASLKKLLGTVDLVDKALSLYREQFADIGLYENEIYPGIEATLSVLAKSGQRPEADLAGISDSGGNLAREFRNRRRQR